MMVVWLTLKLLAMPVREAFAMHVPPADNLTNLMWR
jgi:hypothetical protein